MATTELVLVTGGTGYLAGWTIKTLLDRGYRIRATLRDMGKAGRLRAAVGDTAQLEVTTADLLADAGWREAMAGVTHVLHMASPMSPIAGDPIAPAREGTRRVLEAAHEAGVRRVVVTSSGVAAIPPDAGEVARGLDETGWTEVEDAGTNTYARAKTLAERDAWAFAAAHGLELTTVLPGFILGPLLSREIGPSMQIVARMLGGTMPAVPRIGMSIVDVRDAAELHLRAMTAPEAAGQRLIGSGEFRWFRDIAAILRAGLGEDAARVPAQEMPDEMIRAAASSNPELRELLPSLGRERHLDHAKAARLLGWRPRPVEDTIIEGARSILDWAARDEALPAA